MTWPIRRMDVIVQFLNSRRIPVKAADRAKRQGPYPYYGASGIVDWVDDYIFDGDYLLVSEDGENLRSRKSPIAFMARGKYWVNNHAHILDEREPGILRYLSWALNRTDLSPYITGAAQPKLNKRTLETVEISVPPTDERLAINAILGALDDKIELNRKTAATLEEMARALYRSWFVDFDPVHAKAAGRAPAHMDAQTAALFPGSFGEDGLPEGWELKRLKDLIKLNYGKALKKDLRVPGEFPVYGSGGIGGTHKEPLFKRPTIIVGRKGTVGSLHWAPKGCWPIDTVFYVTTDYPMSLIMRLMAELPLADMNTDAAVPGLNRDNAYRLEIPFPGEVIVQEYSKRSDNWQAKIDQLEDENQTLATLRDTLLPRLMSGELRVGEAKEQVEELA
jgi:type I restriction enzyme, S subunit